VNREIAIPVDMHFVLSQMPKPRLGGGLYGGVSMVNGHMGYRIA
jgi:hypothetical protein